MVMWEAPGVAVMRELAPQHSRGCMVCKFRESGPGGPSLQPEEACQVTCANALQVSTVDLSANCLSVDDSVISEQAIVACCQASVP